MNKPISYQVAVIGSGSAGREAAILAARNGLRVVLIEKDGLGGACFHRGYYAIRAFRACARLSQDRNSLSEAHRTPKMAGWLSARAKITARLVRDLQETFQSAAIDLRRGHGSLVDANTLRIKSDSGQVELIHADYIILATGSHPSLNAGELGPAFVNIDQFLDQSYFPGRVLIVGGGYIGCEIASILRSLGSTVTLIEKNRLLSNWDESISAFVAHNLIDSGVRVHFGQEIDLRHSQGSAEEPSFSLKGGLSLSADMVLVTTGRKPNIEGLELHSLGIEASPFIRVDEFLRTARQNIFAIGDINGLGSLDSLAVAQARTAVASILGKRIPYSARWVPRCLHTDPAVASVGWTEEEANRAGLTVITHSQTLNLVTEEERSVMEPEPLVMKILVDSESRQILGLHAAGRQAAEVVNTATLAIKSNTTIDALREMIFVHPSSAEAIQAFSSLNSLRDG